MKYYQNYHKHTSFSHRYNKDSPLTYMDYFKEYKKLADNEIPTAYSTVEHSWQSPYFRVYDELEKFNKKNAEENPNYKPIKFVFGTEAYWVKDRFEKDSSNCHIVLLAKNDNGRKKINRAIYESFKSGYYYKNRMDLDILLSLPKDDVFVTSACIAFWNKYDDIDDIVLKLNEHFTDFYLEVQYHNTPKQKELNRHILELSKRYNIPIIFGTDSHVIVEEQMADRDDLLRSNKINYEDEDGWYMDLPTIDMVYKRFEEQGVLTKEEVDIAIENTNKILDFEDITLDRSLKVPIAKQYRGLSQEERNEVFENILRKEWEEQYEDINKDKFDQYISEIKHDIAEIEGCNMADYFIDSYEIMKRGQSEYGGILTPSGRGSAVSMFLNKLLRLTKVDKINSPVLMYSERFLTKERVIDSHTPPDIDNNVSDREPFIQAQRDIIGEEGTFDLLALGTLKYKSAFKMYARAYNIDPQLANEVTKQIDKYENAMKHADDEEKEYIDIFNYVDEEKYGYLIKGCQQYMGIVDNLKAHPCFTKGALVMTNVGYKNIEDIEVGDYVLTIDNHFHKVIQLMKHKTNDIYSLDIQGSIPFEVTSNHPFLTSKRKYSNYCPKNEDRRTLLPYKWKEVKDLEKGDLIGVAINQNSIIPNLDFVDATNKNFWWCLGRYFGDGWRTHTIRRSGRGKGQKIKDVIICCNKNNNETEEIISHLDWCDYRVSKEKTTNRIYLKCKGLYEWLDQFGDYADKKHFNNIIYDLPKEYLENLLIGYLSADGHYEKDKNVYTLTTVSKELAYGFATCVHKVYNTPCNFVLVDTNGISNILGRIVNIKPKYKVSFKKYSKKQDNAFFKDGYMWYKFNKKEKLSKEDYVYNFEVEDNHTYTVYNYIVHNCGCLCLDGDAIEEVGVIMVKSESQGENAKETFVAVIESGTIDSFGYLKQDYLIVDSIGLTYDIYKEIGIEPLSVNELLSKIENDDKVWDIYKNGYTMCINQCEQTKSTEKVMRFKPKNISELTQFVAGIRPSFQSMYKIFENREHFDYGIKAFDDLIQDEYCSSSFILYQEHLMKVLGFAGFPMSETYTIIKAISKKKHYVIKDAKEKFIPNFAKAILETKETTDENKALEMSNKVWQVIEDSAQYGFNSAHAFSMAIDSVTLAYLKAYYPLEFYKVTLQRYTDKGNKDKVALIKKEMIKQGIKLNSIKFGDDNRQFSIDKENNAINQTMKSIKNMQKVAPNILYEIGRKNYDDLFFIFKELLSSELNKKSIDIIIKLNYFREYGDINYILNQWQVYNDAVLIINRLRECKQLKKSECETFGLDINVIKKYCKKETEKVFKEIDNDELIKYVLQNYESIINFVSQKYSYEPISKIKKMSYEIGLSGYTEDIDQTIEDNIYIVSDIEKNQYGTPFLSLYHVCDGDTLYIKTNKRNFEEHSCENGDIIKCAFKTQMKKIKDENDNWIESGEEEHILKDFVILDNI